MKKNLILILGFIFLVLFIYNIVLFIFYNDLQSGIMIIMVILTYNIILAEINQK